MKELIILQLFTLSIMINMFLNVTNRTSSAIEELQVDALNKQAIVTFKGGDTYAYGNVSTRAIVNLLFNPDVSLGFWVNNNLLKSERTELLNGDQFDYNKALQYRGTKYTKSEVNLPAFLRHTGTTCTDQPFRVVINFNYF